MRERVSSGAVNHRTQLNGHLCHTAETNLHGSRAQPVRAASVAAAAVVSWCVYVALFDASH